MMVIDWREIALDGGLRREPESDESRLILWVPGETEGGYQYWERIANVARGEIVVEDGLCSTAATAIPARRRVRGLLGKLLDRLGEGKASRTFVLPSGESVEQHGERSVDALLVWSDETGVGLDEDRVRSRWPQARRFQRLGPRLFLVEGLGMRAASANGATPVDDLESEDAKPRPHAEKVLAEARRSGDRSREATALTDLGVVMMSEGDPRAAIGLLEQALGLARQLGDAERESDIIGNLGMALLHVHQPAQARPLFEQEMARARSAGDVMAEKLAAERLGLAATILGDPRSAMNWFERGLALARRVGDRHQEAGLLWYQAIQHAELEQRDAAIAKAQESIALFAKLGKPQAGWYGACLQKYRMGLFDTEPAPGVDDAGGPGRYLGSALVAGVMAGQSPAQTKANPKGTTGPGLLRMALSATKSMAHFASSGFKTTAPDVQRRRIEICTTCEHHTGVRCKICGCFTAAKTRLAHESCPIGKWPA
jgi:Tfp pilus assembly protein PilF